MRIAILADVHNLFCSARQCFQGKIDYQRLRDGITGNRQLIRSIAYLTQRPDASQNGFTSALTKGGWEVKTKEVKIHLDRENGRKTITHQPPAVEITMDAMLLHPKVDCICLVTGDGIYSPLISYLKNNGCHIEVFGFEKMTSIELQRAATAFLPIKQEWSFKETKKEDVISAERYSPSTENEVKEENFDDERQPIVPNQPMARITI